MACIRSGRGEPSGTQIQSMPKKPAAMLRRKERCMVRERGGLSLSFVSQSQRDGSESAEPDPLFAKENVGSQGGLFCEKDRVGCETLGERRNFLSDPSDGVHEASDSGVGTTQEREACFNGAKLSVCEVLVSGGGGGKPSVIGEID